MSGAGKLPNTLSNEGRLRDPSESGKDILIKQRNGENRRQKEMQIAAF
jgi:hypothetical protein